jgi:hypothetical protein
MNFYVYLPKAGFNKILELLQGLNMDLLFTHILFSFSICSSEVLIKKLYTLLKSEKEENKENKEK